ncbi:MAG TPA: hypothetical protein H9711_10050 [Candidatus Mediterraneibacter intestinavium]|nr:hypothetical protein [Candidatus Mediterraneibacter intestinavium]
MNQKLPYYMVYPMPLAFDDERIERMDFEYMKSLYPDIPKRILPYIEEECDRMEYENSMVYDEYPDKLQLGLMCGRACKNIEKNEKGIDKEEMRNLRDLVEVMLYQELYKRRSDNRRRRRRIY